MSTVTHPSTSKYQHTANKFEASLLEASRLPEKREECLALLRKSKLYILFAQNNISMDIYLHPTEGKNGVENYAIAFTSEEAYRSLGGGGALEIPFSDLLVLLSSLNCHGLHVNPRLESHLSMDLAFLAKMKKELTDDDIKASKEGMRMSFGKAW